jgi:hypothetical protein
MDLATILSMCKFLAKPSNFCLSDYHASNSFSDYYHLLLHQVFDVLKDFHILIKFAHKCKT